MGDLHKIVKAKDKKFSDPGFEQLLRMNPEKISKYRSPFFSRPAYQYTKAEVGDVSNLRRVDEASDV